MIPICSTTRYRTEAKARLWLESVDPRAEITLVAAGGEDLVDGAQLRRVPFAAETPRDRNEVRRAVASGGLSGGPTSSRAVPTDTATIPTRSSSESYTFGGGRFDLVVMINVLEHCRDALATLQNAHDSVAEGGYLVLQDRVADDLWSIYWHNVSTRTPDDELLPLWERQLRDEQKARAVRSRR